MDEEKINAIIETLTEKIYSHGHAIGRREAQEIGLPVEQPGEKTENLMWELYLYYEKQLNLNEPIYPEVELVGREDKILENVPIAVIESAAKRHIFIGNIELRKKRAIPSSPQINVNLGLQLPPGILPQQLPQQAQETLQQLVNQVAQIVPQIVQEELMKQSPVTGFEGRFYGGKWHEEK